MGHVMRSAVLAAHLQDQGHQVTFVSHDGGLRYLQKHARRWPTIGIVGMGSKITNNVVSPLGTFISNACKLAAGAQHNMLANMSFVTQFPDVVITDFEPATARYAMFMGKPLIAVDNIHFLNHCQHRPEMIQSRDYSAASFMYTICENLIPFAHRYLITTFAAAPLLRSTTSLHLPILRAEILAAKETAATGEHIVAYFNDKADHASLASMLQTVNVPVLLYGKSTQKKRQTDGNITFCPFSDADFIRDVAAARGVIGGSGFTFMTEAIFLGKPMLAVPYGMQFEQILNANYLSALGYGERCDRLTLLALQSFMKNVPRYADKLREFRHDGNHDLFDSVDRALREVA
jgi:uncharacterized protein (TIGR00661 family)